LLVPPPIGEEVHGLRRALGDPALDRVPVHLTLVPPVNVRQEDLPAALATLRAAAAATPRRLTLSLGPPATFLPDNPVIYLAVGGDVEELHLLRDRVFFGPLARSLTWPFVPHVTLVEHADADHVPAVLVALARYQASITLSAVHLLREYGSGATRKWAPIADAAFGRQAIVGRGGLALELSRSEEIDPEAAALLTAELGEGDRAPVGPSAGAEPGEHASPEPGPSGPWEPGPGVAGPKGPWDPGPGPGRGGNRPIVVTARREGAVVGVAAAWLADDGGHIAVLVASADRRQGIGGHLLAATEGAVAEAGWACDRLAAAGPAGFYLARSEWSVAPALLEDDR
jgi:2'-5' RNA ligase